MGFLFDKYQSMAISSSEDKVLLIASPGSGKTTVLIEKLTRLISNGIDANNILLITFTKKACENMKERFLKVHPTSSIPHFYTFHGLFYNIVRENISKNINIATEDRIRDFIYKLLKDYTDVITDYKINSIMCEITRISRSGSVDNVDTTLPREVLKEIYDKYKRFKLENNFIDFDDLAIKVIELFKNREDILLSYREKFKYILVDEFQDCDDVQFEILRMISVNSKLFCVGDEDQSIYKFRGANPSIMVDFSTFFHGAKKYYLKYNYRSKDSIINFSRNIIENNKLRNKKQLIGKKVEEGEVICKNFIEDLDQGNYIVKDIKHLLKEDVDLNDFAILYRNHSDSFSILSEFIKNNIKINFLDRSFNIFEQFYIKDLINLLLFIDNPSINNFKNICNKITFMFSRKVNQIINRYDYSLNIFDVINCNFDNFHYSDKRNLSRLESLTKRIRKYKLDSRFMGVLNKFGYATYLDNVIKSKNINKSEIDYFIKYFYKLLINFDSIEEFSDSVRTINSIHGVNFGTIHSSKGMEFRCVYIINAQETENKLNNNINILYDEEEERRIFYVGVTRAIDSLKILSPYFINGKFNKEPLKFVREGLMDDDYGKINCENITKVSRNKVILYMDGKKKKIDFNNYLEIT